jgi:hypothetical protein
MTTIAATVKHICFPAAAQTSTVGGMMTTSGENCLKISKKVIPTALSAR